MLAKMRPRRPKLVPRWVHEGGKRAQEGAKRGQERPRGHQDGPKMGPRGPKRAPRRPKMPPRWPQEGPKTGQDSGKSQEDANRAKQDGYNSVNVAKTYETQCKMKVFIFPDGAHMAPTRSYMIPKWPQDGTKMASRRVSRLSLLSRRFPFSCQSGDGKRP